MELLSVAECVKLAYSFTPGRLHMLQKGEKGSMKAEPCKFNKQLECSKIPGLVGESRSPTQRSEI